MSSSRDSRVVFGMTVLGLLALGAILVPLFTPNASQSIQEVLSRRLLPPLATDASGSFHLLGTDAFGRDLAIRTWLGARLSLMIGASGTLLAGTVGIALGAAAGWFGGMLDRVIIACGDALLAIPRLVLLLVIAALWGPGITMVVVVLALTGWMSVMRLVRADVQALRGRDFVVAAQATGIPTARLVRRHLLPNALSAATVAITLGVGNAIVLESGLSFLGLGVQPPAASWGNMIAGGREWLLVAPWIALVPGLLLVVTVVAATLIGEGLRAPPEGN